MKKKHHPITHRISPFVYRSLLIMIVSIFLLGACSKPSRIKDVEYTAPDGSQVAIEKASLDFYRNTSTGGYRLISTEDLIKKIDAKEDILIIDVRSPKQFKKGHIANAINIPISYTKNDEIDISLFIKNIANTLPKNTALTRPVIVYANSLVDQTSHYGAMQFIRLGFRIVHHYPWGYSTWKEAKKQ